jgi:hypothetical protein
MTNARLDKYLGGDDQRLLFRFAFLGKKAECDKYFQELSELAEKENWTTKTSSSKNDVLASYITYTFDKAYKDDLVLVTDDEKFSCFNTGLLTANGEDIICLFNKFDNSTKFHWHITGFRKESDREFMMHFSETPEVIAYFDNPEKIYFNPTLDLVKNFNHILEDNFDRFSPELQEKGKEYIKSLLVSSLDLTIKRIKRNYRIAVPQYYGDDITYLLPVNLDGCKMALAVEYVNKRYRVNTIFTIEMAYKNARLLMKPEADWLEI